MPQRKLVQVQISTMHSTCTGFFCSHNFIDYNAFWQSTCVRYCLLGNLSLVSAKKHKAGIFLLFTGSSLTQWCHCISLKKCDHFVLLVITVTPDVLAESPNNQNYCSRRTVRPVAPSVARSDRCPEERPRLRIPRAASLVAFPGAGFCS